MSGTLILIGIVAALIVPLITARPRIKRSMEARRLRLAEEREAEEAREQRERERALEHQAFIDSQPDYFRGYGIKVFEKLSPPRAADTGAVHLTHPLRWEYWDDDGHHCGTEKCSYGCGELFAMREIGAFAGQGVQWMYLGRYCPACGALSHTHNESPTLEGPLGRRLKGATNLFDALGPPKAEDPEAVWRKLEAEEAALETRLNETRTRRLALAEELGRTIDGGPFRPRLVAKND